MSTATLARPSRPVAARRAATRPAAAPAPASRVRLTRRGRVLVVVVLAVVLAAVFTLGRTGTSQAGGDAALPAPLGVTTVQSGETLWSVARRIAPDADVRQVVQQIRELNHMSASSLQVGQQLLLPVAS